MSPFGAPPGPSPDTENPDLFLLYLLLIVVGVSAVLFLLLPPNATAL